ncbi:MAG: hypothetical protein ABSD31_11180 [Candidatus Binataceae bacterium]|jgi:hypothetical protein
MRLPQQVRALLFVAIIITSGTALAQVATPPPTAVSQARQADILEKIAADNFGAMTEAEHRLVRAAPFRDLPWLGPSADPNNPANDVTKAATWGPERVVRAKLLAWLCTSPQAAPYIHPSGLGLAAARIAGNLDLSYSKVARPLTMIRCYIPDGIDLSRAQLESLELRRSVTGPIDADLSSVNGDVSLHYGAYGPASFFRSHIGGDLDCNGGRFITSGRDALSAIESTIDGDALFHDGFETDGFVDFRLARIGRSLSFNDAHFVGKSDNGLNAERATVAGTLYWVDIQHTARTQLDLENAKVDALWDNQKSWPSFGNLILEGFTYNHFSGGPSDAEPRLGWLNRQPAGYRPQPYRQLAKVLADEGREGGAVDVLIAKQDAQRHAGGLSRAERLWNLMLKVSVGYGYKPLRALWWILGFVTFGTVLFGWGRYAMLMTPTEEPAYQAFVAEGALPPHYPPFNAFIYSLENFLPVVQLHQDAYWRPNPRHAVKWRLRVRRRHIDLGVVPAVVLRWYLWVHIIAGWIFTPLLFAGLSGLIRVD